MEVQISQWIDAPEMQPEGREFAIGDVHGFAEPLEAVLRAMGARAAMAGQGHLTFLGDLTDKGPDHVGALKLATTPGEDWGFSGKTLLAGNHDLFLLLILEDVADGGLPEIALLKVAERNDFGSTLAQIGLDFGLASLRPRLVEILGERGLAEIEGMAGCRRSGNITLSHAGPGWLYGTPAADWYAAPPRFRGFLGGSEEHYTWTRFWWTRAPIDDGIFVHGHTPELMIWGRPWSQDLHRLDGQRLGLDGLTRDYAVRQIVGAEMEPGRYRIYSAG